MSTELTRDPAAVRPGRLSRWVDRGADRLMRLPSATGSYTVTRGVRVAMRDGVELVADHYAPAASTAYGTILVRSPYGRLGLFAMKYARPYVLRGYHVLMQSCRGTFGSGGAFEPMVHEIDDAQDTVAWLRVQPWFNGRLGTIGPSYLGFAQWALLMDPPPELAAAIVVVGPHDFSQAAYGSGAFSLNDFLGWSELVVDQEDLNPAQVILRSIGATKRQAPAMNGLPLADAAEPLLRGRAPWYRQWLSHPERTDAFWRLMQLGDALDRVRIPVMLVGGWHDLFLDQTLEQFVHLNRRDLDVTLTVGPWNHLQAAGGLIGDIVTRDSLEWLDEHVAGTRSRSRRTPVRIHITGANQWRDLPDWPPASIAQVLYLHPGGALRAERPEPETPPSTFTYDPADPTPTVGGRLLSGKAGVRDNRALEARPDVLTFTGPVLESDLDVIGSPVVELVHGTDNPHADLFVRLCEVTAKGRSRNVSDILVRLDPTAEPTSVVRLELDPMAHRFATGSRLRLQVSGGSHPRFARHLGTDELPATGTTMVASRRTVAHGAGGLSRLLLPVVPPA